MRYRLAVLLCATLFTACADRATTSPPALMVPEPRHHLAAAERESLRKGINVDALERLLGRLPPQERGRVLPFFRNDFRGGVVSTGNPEMDALLQEVWGDGDARGGPQAARADGARPVLLAIAADLVAGGAGAVVVRQARGQDVIILSEAHATPAQLWTARQVLEVDRQRNGWTLPEDRTIMVRVVQGPPPGPTHDRTVWALARVHGPQLDAVQRAPVQDVPGIGSLRVVQMEPLDAYHP